MEAKLRRVRGLVAAMVTAAALCGAAIGHAQVSESDVPETAVVPSEGTPPPDSSPAPAPKTKHTTAAAPTHHEAAVKADVEPAEAKLKLITDTPVLSEPAKSSKTIEQAHAGKFIQVTGSTRYFLQVRLKSGQTGYIEPSAVELVKPTDKVFALTSDTPVLDKPNRWGKKVSEVHTGHNVHVIGVALNYTKIKMKSGLEGYISMSALQ